MGAMSWIARWLVTRNPAMTVAHARRLATIATILGAAVVAGLAFAAWLAFHDAGVREETNLRRDNADLTANANANEGAGLSKVERDRAEDIEQKELENAVNEADAAGRSAADDAWNGGLFDG